MPWRPVRTSPPRSVRATMPIAVAAGVSRGTPSLARALNPAGPAHEIAPGTTVRGLVETLGLTAGPVAVERNREVVPRAEHPSTLLQPGDVLEIVHFVGGG